MKMQKKEVFSMSDNDYEKTTKPEASKEDTKPKLFGFSFSDWFWVVFLLVILVIFVPLVIWSFSFTKFLVYIGIGVLSIIILGVLHS